MKVLAYTSPARGNLYPVVPILAALTERGHCTSVCALAGELSHFAPLGIDASAINPALERIPIEDWRESSPQQAAISVMRTFAKRAESEAPDLSRAIEHNDPDVLLIDINCWGAATVAEASERPWAIYSPYLLPLRSRDAPPYGPGLRPRSGPLGTIRDALVRRAIDRVLGQAGIGTLNALRAGHGLPALHGLEELLSRPPLLLSLTAEGFEYRRSDWPSNVRLVGPMHWAPPQPPPTWLADFHDPLVLVTSSTEHQDDERLPTIALQALPAAGFSVIATTAAHDPDAFDMPPGSRVVRFVAHDPILERAACVVCHGGLGITQKALAAAVPVVVVPFGRDQMETARRVEFAGAGVRIPPRRLTPERLLRAVDTAIDCSDGAKRMSRTFSSSGGPEAAADALETICLGRAQERYSDLG
jgi:MGT family glycosyltransferase